MKKNLFFVAITVMIMMGTTLVNAIARRSRRAGPEHFIVQIPEPFEMHPIEMGNEEKSGDSEIRPVEMNYEEKGCAPCCSAYSSCGENSCFDGLRPYANIAQSFTTVPCGDQMVITLDGSKSDAYSSWELVDDYLYYGMSFILRLEGITMDKVIGGRQYFHFDAVNVGQEKLVFVRVDRNRCVKEAIVYTVQVN